MKSMLVRIIICRRGCRLRPTTAATTWSRYALVQVAAIAAAFCVSCSHSNKAAEEHPASEQKKVIQLSDEALKKAEIIIETAGPAVLKKTIKLNDKIGPDEDHTAQINPRFPGIVKAVAKRLGDEVKSGDTLAVIDSNASLQPCEAKAQINGKGFGPREVTASKHDDEFVQIKAGIAAGEKYAADNSFRLKSEMTRPQPGEEE